MIGPEGYWEIMSAMRKNPELRGPDGKAFDKSNIWCRKFTDELTRLNRELGEVKFQQLTDSMDFIRCLFGTPGQYGCIAVCYLCSECMSCPKFDYHWCIVQGSKNWWSCCKCQAPYSPSDPTAFLFGIQMGPNPATDIVWYVASPPMGPDQDLMNLLRCINTVLTGRLCPDKLIDAVNLGGVSAWADEIKELITADGCAFLGQVQNCGVIVEQCQLKGPRTRDPPSQYSDVEKKIERLTVTCADIGANVEFLDFTPVLTKGPIERINNWTTILCWIMSIYRTPDLAAMCAAMDTLPTPGQSYTVTGVGSKANRKLVSNALWLAHYRETGFDHSTGRVPARDWKEWADAEIRKQDENRAMLSGRAKARKQATSS